MTFASTRIAYNRKGNLREVTYKFTGASGDTGGTIQTSIKTVTGAHAFGSLDTGASNILALSVGPTATVGQVRIAYTNPAANHTGYVTIIGR